MLWSKEDQWRSWCFSSEEMPLRGEPELPAAGVCLQSQDHYHRLAYSGILLCFVLGNISLQHSKFCCWRLRYVREVTRSGSSSSVMLGVEVSVCAYGWVCMYIHI